jgi:hypothetical protein
MPKLINWELLREPYNWLIVAAMTTFAVLVIAFLTNGGNLPD